jgi:hypothetical protein
MDERGGYENLRGSDRWSVIPYVQKRTESYYLSLPSLSMPISPPPLKWCLTEPFIGQGRIVYNES